MTKKELIDALLTDPSPDDLPVAAFDHKSKETKYIVSLAGQCLIGRGPNTTELKFYQINVGKNLV